MAVTYSSESDSYQISFYFGHSLTKIANVYIARHIPTKTLVALKKYNLEKLNREQVQLVQDEIILMRQLNHPNVLPVLCSFVSGHEIVSVLPVMGYGSCAHLILRYFPAGLPEAAIAIILKAVLNALHYLHSKGIIHRAVRGSHVLVSAEGHVTLTGLRYSCPLISSGRWQKKVHSFPSTTAPNLNWLSPELLHQNLEGYNEKCDVYSVGVTACELANGIVPYWGTPSTLMLIEKLRGIPPQLLDATTFYPNPINGQGDDGVDGEDYSHTLSKRKFSESFHSAIESCLNCCQRRPSARELLLHSFFKSAPPYSSLPALLLPAVPVLPNTLPDNRDELESIMACERIDNLDLETTVWDF
uniref:Putative pseudokinase domain of ste20-related kinase adapter protein n=1 Tax=Triatoma dimidiata TaxID=72491 RepID=A0A0V0G9W6_TRIDM